ncbi:hypothetical protein J6590_065831 [Homalodisca vitripennis]|nr:hypothetical protein J6590_065831 [Homalodisca vitripennis]
MYDNLVRAVWQPCCQKLTFPKLCRVGPACLAACWLAPSSAFSRLPVQSPGESVKKEQDSRAMVRAMDISAPAHRSLLGRRVTATPAGVGKTLSRRRRMFPSTFHLLVNKARDGTKTQDCRLDEDEDQCCRRRLLERYRCPHVSGSVKAELEFVTSHC